MGDDDESAPRRSDPKISCAVGRCNALCSGQRARSGVAKCALAA